MRRSGRCASVSVAAVDKEQGPSMFSAGGVAMPCRPMQQLEELVEVGGPSVLIAPAAHEAASADPDGNVDRPRLAACFIRTDYPKSVSNP
jgi:hypothetical protein